MHFPFVTVSITLLQVILYAVSDINLILWLQYEHSSLAQIWRLFTYMFVETDPQNLILNLPAQVLLGSLLENFHAFWKVAALYSGGGVMAALSSSFLDKTLVLTGASSGVFAFGFSCLAEMQVCSSGSGRYKQLRLMGVLYLLLVEVYRSLFGLLSGHVLAVHSFGAISGYLLGSALFVGDVNNNDANQHKTYRIVGALYYAFFFIVLIVLNVFCI